jgi:hypothetical protein
MPTNFTTKSSPELLDEASGWLVGGGILTVALFPLAVPLIALTVVFALPLLLVPLALGLVAALVAAPILLVRTLGKRVFRALAPQGGGSRDHGGSLPPTRLRARLGLQRREIHRSKWGIVERLAARK